MLQKQEENLPSVAFSIPEEDQGGTEAETFQTAEKRTGTARGTQVSFYLTQSNDPDSAPITKIH